jgi:bidirectional [NiFe] hydrogenase diaphorase subunit
MTIHLRVNDVEVAAEPGESLLQVVRRAGFAVPSLCHHESVPALGACRLCLVEVKSGGRTTLSTSCNAAAEDGLEVVTDSPEIRGHRAMNLELLLARAPSSPVLRQLAAELGVRRPRFAPLPDAGIKDCILCELCVRVCAALGYHALSAVGRGDHKSVGPPFGQAAADACVGCGACHLVCPTGCIPMKDEATTRTMWGRTFDLFSCRRCHTPFMTEAHRAAVAARGDLPEGYYDLCEACKQATTSEHLATAAR